MTEHANNTLTTLRVGIVLSLVTLLFGFGLGAVFGAAEDWLKAGLQHDGHTALDAAYGGDTAAMNSVVTKSWTYFKRAHLHANGLGTAALAMILLLAHLPDRPARWRTVTATGLGIGALGYSTYWLLAGLRAPGMGSTGAAKESLAWLAIPTSGLCILGLLSVIALVLRPATRKEVNV